MPRFHSADNGDWAKCPACHYLLYGRRLKRNLGVCPECGHHGRLTARERILQLADPDTFQELRQPGVSSDPLQFSDQKPYHERLTAAAEQTGEREAATYGLAEIEGMPIVLFAMDFRFMGGSMGAAVGETLVLAAETALESHRSLVMACTSGGARMQEGVIALFQMARTAQALARLHDAGIFSLSILSNPTFGGVTASFAMLGSVVVAETGALVGFAGPRVISETIHQELPAGFQSSEFLLAHGLVDRVESRAALRPLTALLIRLHTQKRLDHHIPKQRFSARPPVHRIASKSLSERDAWDVVNLARNAQRPTSLDYLRDAFEDFVELHGDRNYGDDPAIVGGLARIGGRSVVVVAQQKGHTTSELVARNFGMPHPEGYRKAWRLLDHAERFGLPVVTLIDTPGAYPGVEAEERGQSGAIAGIIMRSSQLRVPVVSVVTGEGGSGGALALGTGDRLLILENAFCSVISPEGCAAILWRTSAAAPEAARALRITARDLRDLGVADAIIPEPEGGAQANPQEMARDLRDALTAQLDELCQLDPEKLLWERQLRFRDTRSALLWSGEANTA